MNNKYGVRIYPLDNKVILIKQTVKKADSPRYVVDTMGNGEHREAHVDINDNHNIAEAIRTALKGGLTRS